MPWIDVSRPMRRAVWKAATLIACLSTPAIAAQDPATRLVSCGTESCLLVSGRRSDARVPVALNGHVVAVEGARKWRVRVPIAHLRAISEPFARTVTVSVGALSAKAALPIGLLTRNENLAMLIVSVK
ncbi:hypothetical protein [Sphingobium subterraneum]|uniref:Uncharacterized protein n=1 Tax=Sphingobium subterraneum TaxID=627688 RepID=A0A841IZG2_9SPHN|nr:hypothetical protein [Sphingobium subterraneum]MBB6124053.1 hypothetical protein [Sphingobium subterraneum]